MSPATVDGGRDGLALAICALSFGVVCYLLLPSLASTGSVAAENLVLSLPFVVIAVFCFQLELESLTDDARTTAGEDRTRVE